jgi:CheY-like chemotaxis protein
MSEATHGAATAGRRRVLVVEDEWIIAAAIVFELERLGYEVIGPTSSVEDALRHIADDTKDDIIAALLDVKLNKETTTAVADELARRQIPFAFLTGYSARELPFHLRSVTVLHKPATPQELEATLQYLVGVAVQ